MGEYLDRYLAGEYETVWSDLVKLGDRVYEPGIVDDAQSVAREATGRALQNLRTIAERLRQLGYSFQSSPGGGASPFAGMNLNFGALEPKFQQMPEAAQKHMGGPKMVQAMQNLIGMLQKTPALPPKVTNPLTPATAAAPKLLKKIERILEGKLPLALRAWYEQADSVSFQGTHERLNPASPQTPPALAISPQAFHFPPGTNMLEQYKREAMELGVPVVFEQPEAPHQPLPDPVELMPLEEMLDEIESLAEEGFPGPVALAPDDLHKANISGATWDMDLPSARADAPFGRWPGLIPYLREVCAWGGFPGWAREQDPPLTEIEFLTKDLLPF